MTNLLVFDFNVALIHAGLNFSESTYYAMRKGFVDTLFFAILHSDRALKTWMGNLSWAKVEREWRCAYHRRNVRSDSEKSSLSRLAHNKARSGASEPWKVLLMEYVYHYYQTHMFEEDFWSFAVIYWTF